MGEYYDTLQECVLNGDSDEAVKTAKEMMASGIEATAIVQEYLVPILDDIGDQFSRLEIFLPDLMMAADVAKALKDEIREQLLNTQSGGEKAGKIVIGTMSGDVHDIGKNIVATLLEVNGFEVIDLGNDVPPFNFVETAQKENADIIALSSLLTTSMPYMSDVIKALDGLNIRDRFKVVVGGGPVYNDWAMSIGADGYSNDANGAVELCRGFIRQ